MISIHKNVKLQGLMIKQSEPLLLVGFSGVNNAENQFSMPGMEQIAITLCILQSLGNLKLNQCLSVPVSLVMSVFFLGLYRCAGTYRMLVDTPLK